MGTVMKTKEIVNASCETGCTECVRRGKIIERLRVANEKQRDDKKANREMLQITSNLLQMIPSGLLVYQYHPPGELFYCTGNPEGIRLLEASPDRCQGAEFDEMWPNARPQGLTGALMNTARTGEFFETDTAYFRKDGANRVFRLRAFSLIGSRLGIVLEDLTTRIPRTATPYNCPEDLEKTVELGPTNISSTGRVYARRTASEGPYERQVMHLDQISQCDTRYSSAFRRLGQLLATVEAMAQRALTRLESGYFSLARASVEQLLQDMERAGHIVKLLEQNGSVRSFGEETRQRTGTGPGITSTVPAKDKETP